MGYDCYSKYIYNEYHDGIAVLIKKNINHRIKADFITNLLELEIKTSL